MTFDAHAVRAITYPLHEWLCGRRTLTELQNLRTVAAGSVDGLEAEVERRTGALLRFAQATLNFHARRFAAAGVDIHAVAASREIAKLAPLSKADVRAHAAEMVWTGVPGGPIAHSSGGTTGDTLHFVIDRVRQAQTLAARLFMQERLGVRCGERRAYFWGSPIERRGSRLRRWRDRALNEILLDAFELSAESLDRHLARIARFRPALLYAYPSAAAALAQRAQRTNSTTAFTSLKTVVLTGEETRPEERAAITDICACPVVEEYGNREVGLIAHGCLAGSLHVLTPHILLETLAGTRPARPGETGEIVCTTLNTRAQPFIRYRVGDAGARLKGECRCGLALPRMRLDGGKVTGFLALPDGRLCHGAIVSHILRDLPGIVHFKTIQRSLEKFDVLLVTDDHFADESLATIGERYRRLFGERVHAECHRVNAIPPDPSGKRRYFVSEAAGAGEVRSFG